MTHSTSSDESRDIPGQMPAPDDVAASSETRAGSGTPWVDSHFDAGAIDVISCATADAIRLRFRPDNHAPFAQWFYFRLNGARGKPCRIVLEGAAACAFPDGWRDYRAVASYDRSSWFRVDTSFDGQSLQINHTPLHDTVYYAYFEPYSEQRHAQFIGAVQQLPGVKVTQPAWSTQGRPVDCVTVSGGNIAKKKRQIWVIARQHPGETMAEWFVEGLLDRLLGRYAHQASHPGQATQLGQAARVAQATQADDALPARLLERAVFHIVPNMNPDGAILGNLRTNARGVNLNREWMTPDAAQSPEVLGVRDAILAGGCDMFFDIHGDETLPYVFVAGSEMLPGFDARQAEQQAAFIAAFKQASPDFQDEHGYHAGRYRDDALKLASKYVGHAFGCLSLTLEMPFKDNANRPDAAVGWNGARSAALGAAMLEAIDCYLVQSD